MKAMTTTNNNNNYGVTPSGFFSPTYAEVLDNIQDKFKSVFGNNIALESNSNLGIQSRLDALIIYNAYQELQKNFYNSFVSTATDTALDRLGNNFGVIRKVAEPSYVELTIRTSEEYLIQAGEQFETEDGIVFTLLSDVLTEKDENISKSPVAKDEDQDDDTDDDTDDEPIGTFVGKGMAQSIETGSMNNVRENTITVVSNPDDNIDSVTNEKIAGGGQDYEPDETYRERIILENLAKAGSTEKGVYAALMNLSGVRQVGFTPNPTSEVDKDGNPPYSIHTYVLGGNGQEIAQALYDNIAAGTIFVGDESYTVTDVNGFPKTMHFSFASELDIYVDVKLKTNDLWNEDSDPNELKQEISDQIQQLKMGSPVLSTKLYSAIYDFEGISEALVSIGSSQDSLTANGDVVPTKFQVPICDVKNINISNDL
ncbi:MAG: hypothetical protein [Bacteriophage sp.]|nr:MAG: hypothetical protein [Bacteriophage sp.]